MNDPHQRSDRLKSILDRFDRERLELVYPHMRREDLSDVVRHVSRFEDEAKIKYSCMRASDLSRRIEREVAFARERRLALDWQVYEHDSSSADLLKALSTFGFTVGDRCALMVMDLGVQPDELTRGSQHDVRRIEDAAQLADFRSVSEAVWGSDFGELMRFIEIFLRQYRAYMSVYVAYVDEQPVSCARSAFHPESEFSFLLGGSTLREFRNRGLYSALVRARASEAVRRNVPYLVVEAVPASQAVLLNLGFHVVSYRYNCCLDFTGK